MSLYNLPYFFLTAKMHWHIQSRQLVQMCDVRCRVYASSTSGCAFVTSSVILFV